MTFFNAKECMRGHTWYQLSNIDGDLDYCPICHVIIVSKSSSDANTYVNLVFFELPKSLKQYVSRCKESE